MQNVCCRLCDCSEEHMYNLYLHDVSMKSTGSSHEAQPGQEVNYILMNHWFLNYFQTPQNDIIHQSSYELKELLKRLARTTPKGENPSHEDVGVQKIRNNSLVYFQMTNLAFLCIKLALNRGEYKKPWFKFAKKVGAPKSTHSLPLFTINKWQWEYFRPLRLRPMQLARNSRWAIAQAVAVICQHRLFLYVFKLYLKFHSYVRDI